MTATAAIRHTIKDARRGVTYHVLAFRQLTRPEIVNVVRQHRSGAGRTRPRPGYSVTIVTTIGQ